MNALLIFPHQLFEQHPGFAANPDLVVLTEDPLFFSDERYPVNFHRQKLMLHRASMQDYSESMKTQGCPLAYFEFADQSSVLSGVIKSLAKRGVACISVCDVADFSLSRRLESACADHSITSVYSHRLRLSRKRLHPPGSLIHL